MVFESEDEKIFKPFGDKTDDFLFEMANVPKRIHRLPMDIKLQVAQPGDKEYRHAPRVKVFRHRDDEPEAFSIHLNLDATKIGIQEGIFSGLISSGQFNQLIDFIKEYRVPLLNLWYRPGADIMELRDEMDEIDSGLTVEFYGTRRDRKTGRGET